MPSLTYLHQSPFTYPVPLAPLTANLSPNVGRSDEELRHRGTHTRTQAAFSLLEALHRYTSIRRRGDLRVIQDWLGHANVQNTTVYTQITNRKRNEEARRLFMSDQIV